MRPVAKRALEIINYEIGLIFRVKFSPPPHRRWNSDTSSDWPSSKPACRRALGGAVAWENMSTRAREEPVGAANRESPRKNPPTTPWYPGRWLVTHHSPLWRSGWSPLLYLACDVCLLELRGVMLESSLLPPDSWQKGRQDHCRPKWKEEKGGMRCRHFLVGLKQLAAASRSDFRRRRSR